MCLGATSHTKPEKVMALGRWRSIHQHRGRLPHQQPAASWGCRSAGQPRANFPRRFMIAKRALAFALTEFGALD